MLHQLPGLYGLYPAGTWQQYVVVKVDNLFPVRSEVSNEDASQFFVNPCTGQHSVMGDEAPCKIACLHSLTVRMLLLEPLTDLSQRADFYLACSCWHGARAAATSRLLVRPFACMF